MDASKDITKDIPEVAPDTGASAPQRKWTEQRVLAVRWWTPTLLSFRVSRDPAFRFTPGHYARLGLPPATPEAEIVWRPYSVVSASDDDCLEFYAVLVPGGTLSTGLARLREGDVLLVDRAAYGFLTLDQLAPGRDLWLVASGTGLGPFVSILREPSTWRTFERLVVVHGVRHAADLAYRDEILALPAEPRFATGGAALAYVPIVTREPGATALSARIPLLLADGRLEAAAGCAISPEASRFMVCGNPDMAREVRHWLTERGFKTARRSAPGQMAFEHYW